MQPLSEALLKRAPAAGPGYDMEDAMILNAAAVQRGLAHGSLYKTDALDLAEEKGKQLVRARGLPALAPADIFSLVFAWTVLLLTPQVQAQALL